MKKKVVKKQVSKRKKSPTRVLPIYSSAEEVPSDADMPVTKGHFDAFRQELTAMMTSSELLIKSKDKKILHALYALIPSLRKWMQSLKRASQRLMLVLLL